MSLEQNCQILWQPPVPSEMLQFAVANAAAYYVADAVLKGVKQNESDLAGYVAMLSGKASLSFEERRFMRELPEFNAAAEQVSGVCRQLVACSTEARDLFGVLVSYVDQPFSVRIELQTPPGQEHVFFAPLHVSLSQGSWHSRYLGIASARSLLHAGVKDVLRAGEAAVQHAAVRLGTEASQPFVRIMGIYAGYRESVMQQHSVA